MHKLMHTTTRVVGGVAQIALFSASLSLAAENPTHVGEVSIDSARGAETYEEPGFSPYPGRNFPTQVLWGDTHLHTALSLDARAAGVILTPDDALRFAKGEELVASGGERVKLSKALDWLAVSDHSDAIGAMNEIVAGNPALLTDPTVRDWHQRISQGGQNALAAAFEVVGAFTSGNTPEILLEQRFARSMWQDYFTTMDKHNEPGRFTALVAYEWTSTPDQNNLHRNVIYRDGADKALQVLPTTVAESLDPESLWAWMGEYEARTGGSVLAIPHNGNLSNGLMFPLKDFKGKRLTEAYARERARWEPLYEATQIKGDGEAHPFLSPNDEFANYETWDRSNLGSAVKEPGMLQWEYAREALKNGLKVEADLGINPFKFGMVGGTDAHTGLATAEEDNFFGKHTMVEPEAERWDHAVFEFGDIRLAGWEMAGSGLTAVWATENTREAIWDAMARREVYASTGPRISVRLFGGWDFAAEVAHTRLPANTGYARGVPMGGDLTNAPTGTAPSFLVAARKDPLSGNLDRIQIIKGWLDSKGNTHEQVYDVVWSDDREVGANGKVPAVGNTVDVGSATWTNTIGDPELITVWSDPDFDSDQRAFYYARVIEIPTPRWTAYEQLRFGIKLPENVPMTTQERAYTSPIWYTP